MSIGNRIKNCRTENQFTQKELANKLGLTPKMVSFYENDERIPPADILVKLASIFKVSTDYLLGMVEQKMPYGISSYSGQNESTGKSILFWIRKTGLGDDEVAEMLGISEELLKSYYAGESMPLDTLIKFHRN